MNELKTDIVPEKDTEYPYLTVKVFPKPSLRVVLEVVAIGSFKGNSVQNKKAVK